MSGKQLRFENGTVVETDDGGKLHYAPLPVLDCKSCRGWTRFDQESATQTVCLECDTLQSNERIVDLNDERL